MPPFVITEEGDGCYVTGARFDRGRTNIILQIYGGPTTWGTNSRDRDQADKVRAVRDEVVKALSNRAPVINISDFLKKNGLMSPTDEPPLTEQPA